MAQLQQSSVRNRLLASLSCDDFALVQPHLEAVTLGVREHLFRAEQKITHVTFPEYGIASIVADTEEGRFEVGMVGSEGLVGTAVVLGVDRTPHTSYLIRVGDGHDETVRQHCDKRFYVSPFMAMGLNYRFRIGLPGENVAVHITASDDQGPLMVASFSGKRRALSDASLLRAFISYPLLTLKVTAGIHWEALRLWAKGIRLQERPAPPHHSITHVAMDGRLRAKAEPDTI